MINRHATAVWSGDLKAGKGTLTAPGGVLNQTPYSFGMRFESAPGTNPEELVAAAHAGCFSMAFSAKLGEHNLVPTRIETKATVTLEKTDAGFTVTKSHLDVVVAVPGADKAKVLAVAEEAKKGCPISRLLTASISMNATVQS